MRVFLLTAGFGWAISIYGVFAPWSAAERGSEPLAGLVKWDGMR